MERDDFNERMFQLEQIAEIEYRKELLNEIWENQDKYGWLENKLYPKKRTKRDGNENS